MAIRTHAFTRPAASAGSGQTDPLTNALIRRAFDNRPIRHPAQGFAQLGRAALLARHLRKGEKRREGMAKTYGDAMYAGQARPAESRGGIDWSAKLADPGMMARILMGNPDTQSVGWDVFQQEREQAHEMAVEKTKQKYEEATAANERRWDAEKWEIQRQKKQEDALELAGAKTPKSTMADRKLKLLNKWRGAQDGRTEWTDVDQAEWDMIIRADPMDILRRNMLRGMGGDPAASISGSDTPPPSGASAEGPGIFERGYNYLFGSDVEAGQSAPGGNGAASPIPSPGPSPESGAYPSPPRRRPAREIDGPTQPIPRDATGKIDAQRLDVGQVYEKADGTRWRWDGQNFTEVQ